MKKAVYLLALLALSTGVKAEGLDIKQVYFGGGLGFNSLPAAGSSRGFQFFAGYDFDFVLNEDIYSAFEIGYMDSGKFNQLATAPRVKAAKGLWLSMLESVPLTNKVDMLARLGYDLGDDDGLVLGAGMQYKFDTKVAMRMEYVVREHVNGLQVNVRIRF